MKTFIIFSLTCCLLAVQGAPTSEEVKVKPVRRQYTNNANTNTMNQPPGFFWFLDDPEALKKEADEELADNEKTEIVAAVAADAAGKATKEAADEISESAAAAVGDAVARILSDSYRYARRSNYNTNYNVIDPSRNRHDYDNGRNDYGMMPGRVPDSYDHYDRYGYNRMRGGLPLSPSIYGDDITSLEDETETTIVPEVEMADSLKTAAKIEPRSFHRSFARRADTTNANVNTIYRRNSPKPKNTVAKNRRYVTIKAFRRSDLIH